MTRFAVFDLASLPYPGVVETLDVEAIVTSMRDDLVARFPPIAGVIDLESEPARKLIEVFAYREVLLRARINDAARKRMLAFAAGSNLDAIAAYYGVIRLNVPDDAIDGMYELRVHHDSKLELILKLNEFHSQLNMPMVIEALHNFMLRLLTSEEAGVPHPCCLQIGAVAHPHSGAFHVRPTSRRIVVDDLFPEELPAQLCQSQSACSLFSTPGRAVLGSQAASLMEFGSAARLLFFTQN